jgi:hypothetical protein
MLDHNLRIWVISDRCSNVYAIETKIEEKMNLHISSFVL